MLQTFIFLNQNGYLKAILWVIYEYKGLTLS